MIPVTYQATPRFGSTALVYLNQATVQKDFEDEWLQRRNKGSDAPTKVSTVTFPSSFLNAAGIKGYFIQAPGNTTGYYMNAIADWVKTLANQGKALAFFTNADLPEDMTTPYINRFVLGGALWALLNDGYTSTQKGIDFVTQHLKEAANTGSFAIYGLDKRA